MLSRQDHTSPSLTVSVYQLVTLGECRVTSLTYVSGLKPSLLLLTGLHVDHSSSAPSISLRPKLKGQGLCGESFSQAVR